MEDSYAVYYSSNSSIIYSVVRELEDLLKSSLPAPLSRHGPEGALRIDLRITLAVSVLGGSESGSSERYTAPQEKEDENIQQYISVFITSEVEGQLISSNVVASDDVVGEDSPTVTSSGSYWGKTNRSKKEILQHRVVCVKSK